MRAHNAVGRGQTETLELAGSPLRLFADLSPNIVRYLKVLRRGARGRPRSSAPAQRARRDGGLRTRERSRRTDRARGGRLGFRSFPGLQT